jgi:hypothetical protein
LVLRWLICFEVSVISPEDGNGWFPKHCVVLCGVTMENVLINVSEKTYMFFPVFVCGELKI